ncbi:hypothetical protein BU25DRAFT_59731 [Macroventuria anomochaeta]|uniref:Uncharacterized protein n=1 Tax=Macroventuria anomochaeta TaxID=301207 RepID=A0ACB6S2X1_9PLEO|nr:uncharacterized protein BU25DRAFT_59731 [Macroventuria anomochaeta]KAF2627734.1 hypothetical protein BU25DRAFT_59731 [Macroventuria anomochaeta]
MKKKDATQRDTRRPKTDKELTGALAELRIVLLGSRIYTVMICLVTILTIAALAQSFGKRDLILHVTGFAILLQFCSFKEEPQGRNYHRYCWVCAFSIDKVLKGSKIR